MGWLDAALAFNATIWPSFFMIFLGAILVRSREFLPKPKFVSGSDNDWRRGL